MFTWKENLFIKQTTLTYLARETMTTICRPTCNLLRGCLYSRPNKLAPIITISQFSKSVSIFVTRYFLFDLSAYLIFSFHELFLFCYTGSSLETCKCTQHSVEYCARLMFYLWNLHSAPSRQLFRDALSVIWLNSTNCNILTFTGLHDSVSR